MAISFRSSGLSPGAASTTCVIVKPVGLAAGDFMLAKCSLMQNPICFKYMGFFVFEFKSRKLKLCFRKNKGIRVVLFWIIKGNLLMDKIIKIDETSKLKEISIKDENGVWHKRLGSCKRCGKCCEMFHCGKPCEYLEYEYIDNIKMPKCKLQWIKPLGCVLYPLIDEKIIEGCGYYWEEIGNNLYG